MVKSNFCEKPDMNQSKKYITYNEIKLLHSVCYLEPFIVEIIDKAKRLEDGTYDIKISEYDLEDILEAIQYQAEVSFISYDEKCALIDLYKVLTV